MNETTTTDYQFALHTKVGDIVSHNEWVDNDPFTPNGPMVTIQVTDVDNTGILQTFITGETATGETMMFGIRKNHYILAHK